MSTFGTEERILQSALQEFAHNGLEGARVDRIAERAGVNKAMIYYHFKGKKELYAKIIGDTTEGIRMFIQQRAATGMNSFEDLENVFFSFAEYLNSLDLNFVRIMLREISSGGSFLRRIVLPSAFAPLMELFQTMLDALRTKGIVKEVDAYYTFFQIVGGIIYFNALRIALDGSELYNHVFRENYLEEYKRNLSLILREGLMKNRMEG